LRVATWSLRLWGVGTGLAAERAKSERVATGILGGGRREERGDEGFWGAGEGWGAGGKREGKREREE